MPHYYIGTGTGELVFLRTYISWHLYYLLFLAVSEVQEPIGRQLKCIATYAERHLRMCKLQLLYL